MKAASMRVLGIGLALGLGVVVSPSVRADSVKFGGRVGYYTDVQKPILGVEILAPVARRVYFNPNIELVLIDNVTYFTLNGDFHYDFHTGNSSFVWLGGGLGVVKFDPDGPNNGDTDLAANFLGGVGFRSGHVIPYFQAKVIAKDNSEFVIAFGVRF